MQATQSHLVSVLSLPLSLRTKHLLKGISQARSGAESECIYENV
jgi:hypothetical protein